MRVKISIIVSNQTLIPNPTPMHTEESCNVKLAAIRLHEHTLLPLEDVLPQISRRNHFCCYGMKQLASEDRCMTFNATPLLVHRAGAGFGGTMRVTFTRLGRAMMAICVMQGRTLLNHVLGLQFSIHYKFSHSAKIYALGIPICELHPDGGQNKIAERENLMFDFPTRCLLSSGIDVLACQQSDH
jgi:hypothetical protein